MNRARIAIEPVIPWLMVGAGGGLGAVSRFLISEWIGGAPERYPLSTFAVNISGAALLGLIVGSLSPTTRLTRARAFATAGFCGGYTTFSTFSGEIVELINAGKVGAALLYALASVVGCLVALAIGYRMGRRQDPTATVAADGRAR